MNTCKKRSSILRGLTFAAALAVLVFTGCDNSTPTPPPAGTDSTSDLGDGLGLLETSNEMVEMKVDSASMARLTASGTYYAELQAISKTVYTKFKDDFDFLFFVLNKEEEDAIIDNLGFYGVNLSVSNAVQGIGKNVGSGASSFGSSGKLKSLMYFPSWDAVKSGPSLHELAHNWGAFICPTFGLDGSPYGGHWGVSNAGGQLGGFKYVRTVGADGDKTKYQASMSDEKNSDGAFTSGGFGPFVNDGNGIPYSDIELYLMGMKSADELRASNFRLDVYTGCSDAAAYGCFSAAGVTSYTIDDLIALSGERTPDSAASQKSFKVLTVLLSGPGDGNTHHTEIADELKWFAGESEISGFYNFKQATGGVGSLVVGEISASLKDALINVEN